MATQPADAAPDISTFAHLFDASRPLPAIARTVLSSDAVNEEPFPAFDPEHPDTEILQAFENVRAFRAWYYLREENFGAFPEEIEERFDKQSMQAENAVYGNFASSPAGVAARISLLIPAINQERCVDQRIMKEGIRCLYRQREGLDGNGEQLAQAAYELVYIEWDYALDAYRESVRPYTFAADVRDEISAVLSEAPDMKDKLEKLGEMARQFEQDACNFRAIKRLMRTLVPDEEELGLKTQILAKEGLLDEQSAPWLARDAAFLAGRLDGSIPDSRRERLRRASMQKREA